MSLSETTAVTRQPLGVRLFASELSVLFRRWRTWAMLAALGAVPMLIGLAVKFSPKGPPSGRGPAFLDQITHNGLFVGVVALVVSTPLFLPLTVGVVAGDTIAGEAGLGTLRYLLAAPTGRIRLLVVKYVSSVVFCAAAALAVVLGGTITGAVLFPLGQATLLSGDTIGPAESFGRLLLMAGYVTVSLLGLSAIGLFASSMTTVPVGAMAATVVLAVVSQVLDNLDQLDWLHPWLFTDKWLALADLLRQPISWTSFGDNALLQLGYIALFGALAYGRFTTKDVLS
ncbi:ABC transporter permease [Sinomonas sp. ASV322]|uniref:ABC transporter permease n=1 Tax=Sinomonas sp. ASV322 TaxID=3041920 RepID=UPI0027DD5410|nr:ABC transporter permease [Sinomonas sp. ASV322]MDQ4502703.1 ABC transporter permease [Sinomonas sp. ASV322]